LVPLADRREDLGLRVAAILARAPGSAGARFTAAAVRHLFAYDWPRNIRELEECLLTALALAARSIPRSRHGATSWTRCSRPTGATWPPSRAPWARRARRSSAGEAVRPAPHGYRAP